MVLCMKLPSNPHACRATGAAGGSACMHARRGAGPCRYLAPQGALLPPRPPCSSALTMSVGKVTMAGRGSAGWPSVAPALAAPARWLQVCFQKQGIALVAQSAPRSLCLARPLAAAPRPRLRAGSDGCKGSSAVDVVVKACRRLRYRWWWQPHEWVGLTMTRAARHNPDTTPRVILTP